MHTTLWTNHEQGPLSGDIDGTCLQDCKDKIPGLGVLMDMVASGLDLSLQGMTA